MLLEPLYRARFTTPEAWSVTLQASGGSEGQSFLIAEGRVAGRVNARYRAANFPRRRVDGSLVPEFRGVLETDDGATILFNWNGLATLTASGMRRLAGSLTHLTDDERYAWLNDTVCALTGEVRPLPEGEGFEVILEVAELVWEQVSEI
jgi:Protein of unknown function (DUF3237)